MRSKRFSTRVLGLSVLFALVSLSGTTAHVFASTPSVGYVDTAIIYVHTSKVLTTTPHACNGVSNTCAAEVLVILNRDRAEAGLSPLTIKEHQSAGIGACVGSYGHSVAMARSNAIWHVNARYPRASFPKSICVPFVHAGENVGESGSGNVHTDLRALNTLMMSEPHSRQTCATVVNHACNILDPAVRQVGIGVHYTTNATWLTEDFTS